VFGRECVGAAGWACGVWSISACGEYTVSRGYWKRVNGKVDELVGGDRLPRKRIIG
jgi:hypothetical protein